MIKLTRNQKVGGIAAAAATGILAAAMLFSRFGASTITVPPGGDLQAAINSAQAGDTIVLQADADYVCGCTLPVKSGTSYVTIKSSRYDEIGQRAGREPSPIQQTMMARVHSLYSSEPAFKTALSAHHYQLLGLDIRPKRMNESGTDIGQAYSIVSLGSGGSDQNTLEKVAHNLKIDRSWIHGAIDQEVQRCVSLNSAHTDITNSWITDCHGFGYDSQAIGGWNGPGPYNIINNTLEGAGENVMFGGALASIPGLIPSNIVFKFNYVHKPISWKVGDPAYAGRRWSIKNLLELKNAKNVDIDSNVFENSWGDAQIGYAVLFTVRGEGNKQMPHATIQNVRFANNVVRNSEQGIQTLGLDYIKLADGTVQPSTRASGLHIYNNQFINIKNWGFVINGFYNTTLEHNTHEQGGNLLVLTGDQSQGFIYKNNVTRKTGGYGVFGDGKGEGITALEFYTPGYVFSGNVIAGVLERIYPPNNFYPADLSQLATYKGTDNLTPGYLPSLASPSPTPIASMSPTALPSPSPSVTPINQPSADGTKAVSIIDSSGGLWTLGSAKQTLRNNIHMAGGYGSIYKWLGGVVYVLGMDNNWYKWTGSGWNSVGAQEPGGTTPTPTQSPIPSPSPVPSPTISLCQSTSWPNSIQGQNSKMAEQRAIGCYPVRRVGGGMEYARP